ncbi:gamma-glutamyl-gamma-aminobutyrate hydrolase family protein [Alteribacter keqinensis]|uniref:Gamma-glutamyl-gamma-aminobutyrate hydrolase family protein n=1 Tax=Alteribacter keqinensis TaxID=2483800 RepID=A0A3M7TW50_9BACI|nr:gamma-glutamyl-gamma-aminobutyrate hydrolase family protein [Alteribacter keqinensis]RNA69847.1 gamma-glutamyl-gamma-aminobutyrate hydrolase family protein [Alteribacter keqinensis]
MKKPIIGITSSYVDDRTLQTSYDNIRSVLRAGGTPFVLPNVTNQDHMSNYVNTVDGIVVTGGGDIDPTLFGEEPHPNLGLIHPDRDVFEVDLLKEAMKQDKPILAICRGCQILNIAAGGDMYQDIYTQMDHALLQHTQRAPRSHGSHFIEVTEGSLLHSISKQKKYKVNSFHHQTVREMAPGFNVIARSSDQVIEAFQSTKHTFVLGVQWHPECMTDEPSVRLFKAFIEACEKKKAITNET